jgi:aryl-alcohol dehydrogenase-like predicted oxidoreductase
LELRALGRSDIQVSAIGLGVMNFGAQTAEADAFRMLDMAHGSGITLFDTAENYPSPTSAATQGRSEQILGNWIATRSHRARVVVATKVAGPGNAAGDMTHIRGAGRRLDQRNIVQAVDDSLRRLRTDYIDLYQVHWAERPITTLWRSRYSYIADVSELVPLEETLAALDALVKAGKLRQVGVCNESPWGVMRYLTAARELGLPRIASIQNGYSLLDRYFELGLAEIAMREQIGLLAFSPLAGGVLTGKYGDTAQAIPGSRSSLGTGFAARLTGNKLHAAGAYAALARQHGLEPLAMALAFVRQQPFTTSVLMAASSPAQLELNLRDIEIKLSKELVRQINAIHDERPNP